MARDFVSRRPRRHATQVSPLEWTMNGDLYILDKALLEQMHCR